MKMCHIHEIREFGELYFTSTCSEKRVSFAKHHLLKANNSYFITFSYTPPPPPQKKPNNISKYLHTSYTVV